MSHVLVRCFRANGLVFASIQKLIARSVAIEWDLPLGRTVAAAAAVVDEDEQTSNVNSVGKNGRK